MWGIKLKIQQTRIGDFLNKKRVENDIMVRPKEFWVGFKKADTPKSVNHASLFFFQKMNFGNPSFSINSSFNTNHPILEYLSSDFEPDEFKLCFKKLHCGKGSAFPSKSSSLDDWSCVYPK